MRTIGPEVATHRIAIEIPQGRPSIFPSRRPRWQVWQVEVRPIVGLGVQVDSNHSHLGTNKRACVTQGVNGHSPGCEIVMGLSVRNTKTWGKPDEGHRRE